MAQQKDPAVFSESDSKIYEDIRTSLTEAREKAFSAINSAMVAAYWEIGRQINEAVGDRADYGKKLLAYLSGRLTAEFGKGFTVANLRNMRQFYQTFPIRYALRSELTWTHYRMLMRITDLNRREPFDYTQWRQGLYKDVPLDTFLRDAQAHRDRTAK